MAAPLLTFGHGTLDRAGLAALLEGAGIELVVDVRRFPGSRANAVAARGEVPALLADLGVGYRWDERLGGRRHLSASEDAASPDTWWRVAAFRAYAAWTRSEEFRAAVPELLADVRGARTAVMCSEAVWWRCHRRLIADVLLLGNGVPVSHLLHSGRLAPHVASEGARLDEELGVVWDGLTGPDAEQHARPGPGPLIRPPLVAITASVPVPDALHGNLHEQDDIGGAGRCREGNASMTELYLVRHGQTEWSSIGRHTSVTDLDLTETGEAQARALRTRLDPADFQLVLSSPRLRARRTAELAGFPDVEVDEDLAEWYYGDFEGLTSDQIREQHPGWRIWFNGCRGGESADQVRARLTRVVARVRA